MKLNALGLFAVVLAIAVSSFTVTKVVDVYAVYDGSGAQNLKSNYTLTQTTQSSIFGSDVLAWFKFQDADGIEITDAEFNTAFEVVDRTNDNLNTLNDEPEGAFASIYFIEKQEN